MKQLINNVLFVQGQDLVRGSILIEGRKIAKIDISGEVDNLQPSASCHVFDGRGQLLIPGMIDVHIHGADNHDMMDGTRESIQAVSKACAATGCTSFLVTSVSSTLTDLLQLIERTKEVIGHEEGAKIAGIHLEGPYLNVAQKGMQNPKFLRHPDLAEMAEIFAAADGLIKMVTIAPELPGGLELIQYLKEQDVVISIAHSAATYEEAQQAFKEGATHITHCFNAMPAIHHRSPGLVTAALEEDEISVQAIVDGVHLHPGIVRLLHKVKGAEKMVLTTDALQAMGVGDGEYQFGGHQVTVKDGVARLKDGTLASSTVTMNQSLRHSVDFGIPLVDAIRMASLTPAEILKLNNMGKIKEGYLADFVLLDSEFVVQQTWVDGKEKLLVGRG